MRSLLNEDMVRDIGIHAIGGGLAGATLNALHNNSMSYANAITQGGIFGALGGLTLSLASQIVNKFLGKRERRLDVAQESLEELPDQLVEEIKALNLPEEFYSSPEWEEVEVYIREIVNKPELAEDADTTPNKLIASLIMVSFIKWKHEREGNKEPLHESITLGTLALLGTLGAAGWEWAGSKFNLPTPSKLLGKLEKARNAKEGVPYFTDDRMFGIFRGGNKAINQFATKHAAEIKAKKMTADQVKEWYKKENGITGTVTDVPDKDAAMNNDVDNNDKDAAMNNDVDNNDEGQGNQSSNTVPNETRQKLDDLERYENGNGGSSSVVAAPDYHIKAGTLTQDQIDAVSNPSTKVASLKESYISIVESWIIN